MTLASISDRYWKTYSEYNPTVATVRGVHDYDDRLRRFDDNWLGDMASRFRSIVSDAEALPEDEMPTQDRITKALLIQEAGVWATEIESRFLIAAIDPYLGPHTSLLSSTRQNTVSDASQADALLGRYSKVPEYLESAMSLHKENSGKGMTPAAASLERVLDQLSRYLASSLDQDPFLVLSYSDAWTESATKIVTESIRPAFERYRNGLVADIAPTARPDDKCGLVWVPNGEEIYSQLIQKYTQTDIAPTTIHETGQMWATEINASEWVEIGGEFLDASTMEEIFERLHGDPDLRFSSEEQMLDHARTALARAWDAVDDWFGARPETPCDVVPVPSATAPAMPPAYYMQPPIDGSRPGTYFLNTYKPEERDLFEYESIHFHEGIPGHHFDRSLASELEGIPTFRRYAQVYAHTEGWGLYSERLADEMGLYSGPTDRLGMVSADAWRAGRLVTDSGIHALGWSRQQAVDFLRTWTPISQLTVAQEVDRYIGMPGQAVSYKIGQLEILRLREKAEETLGDRFAIMGFHDTMLTNGAMPLPLLETAVDDWVLSVA